MHYETPIYQAVEKLGDLVLAAGARMPRGAKPLLGGRLFDETTLMAILVRRAAIARGAEKVAVYDELLEELEATVFMLRRGFANRFISASAYASTMPLIESVGKQATALRNKFAPAS